MLGKPLFFSFYRQIQAWSLPLGLILVWLLWPAPMALALQSHATPEEGLYSHQFGHLFFMLSLVFFAFWLQKTRLVQERGWRFLQISCFLLALWNIDAIAGHELELWLSESRLVGVASARIGLGDPRLWLPYIYFFLKLDHLLSVPALILLFIGLRKIAVDFTKERN
jgi:hypothetical protein